jgi:hypothetical protein
MKTKTVGKRPSPKTPEEFHALGAKLDLEAKALDPHRPRGFVVKFRTWEDLERWEANARIQRARRMRANVDSR